MIATRIAVGDDGSCERGAGRHERRRREARLARNERLRAALGQQQNLEGVLVVVVAVGAAAAVERDAVAKVAAGAREEVAAGHVIAMLASSRLVLSVSRRVVPLMVTINENVTFFVAAGGHVCRQLTAHVTVRHQRQVAVVAEAHVDRAPQRGGAAAPVFHFHLGQYVAFVRWDTLYLINGVPTPFSYLQVHVTVFWNTL